MGLFFSCLDRSLGLGAFELSHVVLFVFMVLGPMGLSDFVFCFMVRLKELQQHLGAFGLRNEAASRDYSSSQPACLQVSRDEGVGWFYLQLPCLIPE